MHILYTFLLLIGALLIGSPLSASAAQGGMRPDLEYLRESPSQSLPLTLSQALHADGWTAMGTQSPNFGYVQDIFWFRFRLPGAPERGHAQRIVEISYPQLDHVDFFLFRDGELIRSVNTGDRLPFRERPVHHPSFLFPLDLTDSARYEIVLRVESRGALQVPLVVWEPTPFFEHISWVDQAHALYYGILIVIIFFNLFVYLAMRESMYLLYVLSTLGYLFLLATLRGITYPLLWPDSPWLQNQGMLISIPLAMIFSCLFARNFLNLQQENPRLDRWILGAALASMFSLVGTFMLDYNTSIRLSVALAIPSCLLLTIIGPLQWWRGSRPARLYSIAWGLLTLGSAMTALNKFGVIPNSFFTEFGMQIGSALEAILLTLALVERLYRERQDKVIAQDAQLREHAVRRQAELKLMDQALHHPVTRLPNRTCFEMLLRDVLHRESGGRHAVGVVQLMNYPVINKTLGHNTTDQVLASAARRLNQVAANLPGVRVVEQTAEDVFYIASLETGTFAYLLDAEQARTHQRQIARCLDQLREPVDYLGMLVPLEPIAGVAIYPDHSRDPGTLIRQAYVAQESSDAQDRGLAYYQPTLDSYNAERLTLVSDLKKALAEGALALAFQPKMRLTDRQIVGVEALIRWPERKGSVTPDALIKVAEQTGLIKPITRWVMEQAVGARENLLKAGHDLAMSVNISANNLREPDFPLFVQRLLTASRTPNGKLALELTETAMMLDPNNSLRALRSLDVTGIPLSIDDFGSGYSSLSYIKQLPAREIKIDRSLITDLAEHADDRVIVETTIAMCHNLGYTVVAEGVEDEATLDMLTAMGCDLVQGYVLTPPLPLPELLIWLDRHRARQRASG